jgi:repressor LexA
MIPKIKEGDLVIARKSNVAESKDTIVCVYNSEALIKKFHRQGKQIILQSENESKYPPVITEQKKVRIEGVVRGIIQYS